MTKTIRQIISTALTRWIEQRQDCKKIKLVHLDERFSNPLKVDEWVVTEKVSIGQLATQIEDTATNDARNSGREDGIVEIYGIIPYFGNEHSEGAISKFRVNAIMPESEDGGDSVTAIGKYSEGASGRGAHHQGMRHTEAFGRMYFEGAQGLIETQRRMIEDLTDKLLKRDEKIAAMQEEVQNSKDRSVERQLAVYSSYEQEQRVTKFLECAMAALPGIIAAWAGRPILPESTENQAILQMQNLISSLTVEDMELLQKLGPQKYMPIMMLKSEVEEKKQQEEARKQREAEQRVQGIMKDENALKAIAKNDQAGIPRPSL